MYAASDPRAALNKPGTTKALTPKAYKGSEYARFYDVAPSDKTDNAATWYTRGQNMIVGYSKAAAGAVFSRENQVDEYVLLLPQRGAREVVEHRVRQALRNRQGHDERITMGQDGHCREDGDRPVAQRLAHRRDDHERRPRPSTNDPRNARNDEPAAEEDEKSRPGKRVGG